MVNQNNTLDEDTTYAKELLLCEIGQKLQFAREAKGLSLDDVIRELKLNGEFLEALESGDWAQMPGEVYAIGFLRQYASLLAIDFSDEIERIKTNRYELTVPLTFPDAPISPNRTWVFSAALLFLLIIIVANLFDTGENPDSSKPQTMEQSSEPVTEPPVAVEDKLAEDSTPVEAKEAEEPEQAEMVQSEPVRISTMAVDATKPEKTSTSKVTQAETTATQAQADSEKTAESHEYTFSAVTADVWLQLFEKPEQDEEEGTLIREALLTMGESFTIHAVPPLLLTSGKPTALRIERDGEMLFEEGQLGQEGKVLKRFELE